MIMTTENLVIHPVVVVKVNNIMCQALLDTDAASSYASATLLDQFKLKLIKKETKNIGMMISSATKKSEIYDVYDVEISEFLEKFKINSAVYKVEKKTGITTKPKIQGDHRSKHLAGINMNNKDKKPELLIHMVLGASDYARIKVPEMPRLGTPGETVPELTRFR